MNKSDLELILTKYKKYRTQLLAFGYVDFIISWDSETIAPINCFDDRSLYMETLTEMRLKISKSEDYINTVNTLYENREELSLLDKKEIEKVYEDLEYELKVPEDEIIHMSKILSKSANIWSLAKVNDDYDSFKDVLKEIIDFEKRVTKYLEKDDLKGYDVLLNMYEKGMTKKEYDEFFDLLRKELVPLVKQISEKKNEIPSWAKQKFPIEKQKEFAEYIAGVMVFDKDFGIMGESEHPFTNGFGTNDIRITNHFYEDLCLSSIFSAIHELGHATYEHQCDPIFNGTYLSGGTTMAMHESQSRFYENIVGRSYEFWEKHYPKLKEVFKTELESVSLDEFYKYANFVECSLIRTEADELTYPLHVMVRYEMEKQIIENDYDINELPSIWNKLYYDYLGVVVPSDKEGILQDSHWAGGSFGYFPTYALGSAYASQLFYYMKKDLNIKEAFGANDLTLVHNWLKEHVHKFAGSKTPDEIIYDTCNEHFNPKYYVDYLKDKFKKIYNL